MNVAFGLIVFESNVLPSSIKLVIVCGTLSLFVHSIPPSFGTVTLAGSKLGFPGADEPGRILVFTVFVIFLAGVVSFWTASAFSIFYCSAFGVTSPNT